MFNITCTKFSWNLFLTELQIQLAEIVNNANYVLFFLKRVITKVPLTLAIPFESTLKPALSLLEMNFTFIHLKSDIHSHTFGTHAYSAHKKRKTTEVGEV